MKKRIKTWGSSLVIVFTKDDIDLYGIKEGDVINMDDLLIIEKTEFEKLNAKKIRDFSVKKKL